MGVLDQAVPAENAASKGKSILSNTEDAVKTFPQSATYQEASRSNPDEVGESRRLAGQLASDPVAIHNNLPEARRAASLPDFEQMTDKTPVLAKEYEDTKFAAVSHDDHSVLGNAETAMQQYGVNTPNKIADYEQNLLKVQQEQQAYYERTGGQYKGIPNRRIDDLARGYNNLEAGSSFRGATVRAENLDRVKKFFDDFDKPEDDSLQADTSTMFGARPGETSSTEEKELLTTTKLLQELGVTTADFEKMEPEQREEVKKQTFALIGKKLWDDIDSYLKSSVEAQSYEQSPAVIAAAQAQGFSEVISTIWDVSPTDTMFSLFTESLPVSAPSMIVGAVTGGAGLGLVGGALSAGAVSFSEDVMIGAAGILSEHNVDITDRNKLLEALSDEKLMAKVMEEAQLHGIGVAVFDSISFGLAGVAKIIPGKTLQKISSSAYGQNLAELPIRAAVDGALGGSGELAGQQLANPGSKVEWFEVVAEVIGEFGSAPGAIVAANVAQGKKLFQTREARGQKKRNEQLLDSLETASKDSKTNERDPDSYKNFTEKAAKENNIDTIYLQTSDALELMQNKGMSNADIIEWFSIYDASMNDLLTAIDTGGYISLDVGQVITRFREDELLGEMKPHMTPDQMTSTPHQTENDINDNQDVGARLTEMEGALIQEDTISQDELPDIEQQLIASGMSEREAGVNAQLMVQMANARAAARGISPKEFLTDKWRISFPGVGEGQSVESLVAAAEGQDTDTLLQESLQSPLTADELRASIEETGDEIIELGVEDEIVEDTEGIPGEQQAGDGDVGRATEADRGRNVLADAAVAGTDEASLTAWAEENGLMIDGTEFTEKWNASGQVKGQEHQVIADAENQIVTKRRTLQQGETWADYLQNVRIHNQYFPETAYELKGFSVGTDLNGNESLMAVVDQSFAIGDQVEDTEIRSYMEANGFTFVPLGRAAEFGIDRGKWARHTGVRYVDEKTGVVIFDLHKDNIVKGADGSLFFIDPMIGELPTVARDGKVFFQTGQQSEQQAVQTETPAFKEWFGDSKVVDENGAPLVVYHGTGADVNGSFIFDYSKIGEQGRSEGAGFYFTPNKSVAEGYATGTLLDVYISMQNPIKMGDAQFEGETLRNIITRMAELEAVDQEMDIEDGFLSNFGDARFEGLDSVIDGAVELTASSSDEVVDQISGFVGAGVDIEIVNRAVQEITGHDGVIAAGFGNEGDIPIYVAFFPEQIKSATENVGTFDPADPNIFKQEDAGKKVTRGAISFGRDADTRTVEIHRFENANFSTFAHEAAHFFLEDLRQGALEEDVTVGDWEQVRDWLGAKDDKPLTVEQHEKFARGFEAYLREGNAPSLALERVFAEFKNWLTAIYRSLRALDVELTDEVRGVFDRLIATEAQIKEAQTTALMVGILDESFMREAGATTEEINVYKDVTGRVSEEGSQKVNKHKFKDIEKRMAGYRKTANAESYEVPVYRFMYWITRGVFPDVKKSRQVIEDTGGELANSFITEAKTLIESTSEPLVVDGNVLKATVSNAPEWFLDMNRNSKVKVDKKTAANALKQYGEGKALRSKEGQRVVDEYLRSLGNQLARLATNVKVSDLQVGDVYTSVVDGSIVESSIIGENIDEGTYDIKTDGVVEQVSIPFNVIEDVVHVARGANDTIILAESIGGGKTGAGFGLDPQIFKISYGEVIFNAMPKIPGLWKEMGLTAQQAAIESDYPSAKELVDDLQNAQPRQKWVDQRVAQMDIEHNKEIQTDEAIRSETSRRMLAIESEWMAKKISSEKKRLSKRALRRWAEQRTDKQKMRDAQDIHRLMQDSRRTRQKAISAQAKGQFDKAFDLNEQVRMLEELILVHGKVREDVKKMQRRWSRAVDADMHNSYRQQVYLLLEKHGMVDRNLSSKGAFTNAPDEVIPPLSEFMANALASVSEFESTPFFADWIVNGQKEGKWNSFTWEQLQEMDAIVGYLVGRGREAKGALLSDGKTKVVDAARQLAEGASSRRRKKTHKSKSLMRKITTGSRKYFAGTDMLNFTFRRMDGFVNVGKKGRAGLNETLLWNRLAEARDARDRLMESMHGKIDSHIQSLLAGRLKDSELEDLPLPEIMAGDNQSWDWEKVVSVALNMGNIQNIDRMIEGFDLTMEQLQTIAGKLTESDWKSVQGIWNAIDSLYPDIDKVHYNINNFHVKKINADSINVRTRSGKGVSLEGGYYPLKYDPTLSDLAASWNEKDDILMSQESMFGVPAAKSGFTQGRVSSAGGLPIRLSLSVLAEHINDSVQYITHAETVRDIDRITRSPVWKEAAMGSAKTRDSGIIGEPAYRSIRPALAYAIRPDPEFGAVMDKFADKHRVRATAYILAWNFSVAAKQVFSLPAVPFDVGMGNFIRGVVQVSAHPLASYTAMHEVSTFMRNRANSLDRDIMDSLKKMKADRRFKYSIEDVRNMGFVLIKAMDFLAVYPSWWAAYKQEIARTGDLDASVRYADETVRASQPSGTPIDLSTFQRQRGFIRFFTMFSTFVMKYGNRQRYHYNAWKEGTLSTPQYMWNVWLESVMPPAAMSTLFGLIQSGEPPEPEELAKDIVLYQFVGLPFVRDVISAGVDTGFGRGSSKISSPVLTGAELTADALSGLMEAVEQGDERAIKRLAWSMAKIMSYSSGIPVSRVYEKMMKGIEDLERGKGTPINLVIPRRKK